MHDPAAPDERLELHKALNATRSQLKAGIRTLRACLQMTTDLEERLAALAALEDAQPKEAQRHDHDRHTVRA